ncbi:hypothetical protein QE152_g30346 [Popillia japonica]|uniref:Uncharacterized protein n=1 Tax=Popillia japonica TaxID=7064 RepID=A0AAW1JF81_POPJA
MLKKIDKIWQQCSDELDCKMNSFTFKMVGVMGGRKGDIIKIDNNSGASAHYCTADETAIHRQSVKRTVSFTQKRPFIHAPGIRLPRPDGTTSNRPCARIYFVFML